MESKTIRNDLIARNNVVRDICLPLCQLSNLKSGIPAEVDIPAPAITITFLALPKIKENNLIHDSFNIEVHIQTLELP